MNESMENLDFNNTSEELDFEIKMYDQSHPIFKRLLQFLVFDIFMDI